MTKKRLLKFVAVFLLAAFLNNIFFPTVALALTAGPASPEFASFEPVATTDMVNIFSGDFTYNLPVLEIPGPDGGGYAMSLSYHSGASCEEEASWVGFGWTLNPGAINRQVRGFPDEWSNRPVDYYNKMVPNWTLAADAKLNIEVCSKDIPSRHPDYDTYSQSGLSFQIGTALRYNNYQGFNRSYSLGASFAGFGGLGMEMNSAGITFSADIKPWAILNRYTGFDARLKKVRENYEANKTLHNKRTLNKLLWLKMCSDRSSINLFGSSYGMFTYSEGVTNVAVAKYQGYDINFTFSAAVFPAPFPAGFEGASTGTFSAQFNEPRRGLHAYGAMNTDYTASGRDMEDYYVEKSQPFDKRDLFIGIPFSTEDNFTLTGEGLSGAFRYYDSRVGHFSPQIVKNKLTIFNLGVALDFYEDVGIGLTFGAGSAKTELRDWKENGSSAGTNNTDNYPPPNLGGGTGYFVFDNDLGSSIQYGDLGNATAKIIANPNFPGIKAAYPSIHESNVWGTLNNSTIQQGPQGGYIDRPASSSCISPISGSVDNGFEIYNEDGTKYKYGQAVLAQNETNISIDIDEAVDPIAHRHLAYKYLFLKKDGGDYKMEICDGGSYRQAHNKVVVGEGRKATPYPTSYLLTEITNTDYVDLDNDHVVSEPDLGGWTKFDYYKAYGGPDWYRWRVPYNGLLYQHNQISDTKDDMGYVSTGEKEVYYMSKIETKSHVAYFVTNTTDAQSRFNLSNASNALLTLLSGTGTPRTDGLSAEELNSSDNTDPAAKHDYSKGGKHLEYLEKIVLFSKDRPEKPIKTIYFKYKNYLVPNLPNSTEGSFPNSDQHHETSGKLTLERVWTEYDGTVSAKISPYEFVYKYKDKSFYTSDLTNENTNLEGFFNLSDRYSDELQNPEYRPYLLDAWGNIQPRGEERHRNENPWIYQGALAYNEFDPAAWQLKQIRLPSGGEILIEYEQKDYAHVQDRPATAMASIVGEPDELNSNGKYGDKPKYFINPYDVGVDPSVPGEMEALREKIYDYYVRKGNKIYFKFLYALYKDHSPALDDCKSEYITGYADVWDNGDAGSPVNNEGGVVIDPSGTMIKITLDGEGNGFTSEGYVKTPRQACYDFYSTQRLGKYERGCESVYDEMFKDHVQRIEDDDYCNNSGTDALWNVIRKFHFVPGAITTVLAMTTSDLRIQPPSHSKVGRLMNTGLSYLKIPMTKAKKGGGIRVKRLLMYDPGIDTDNGDAVIYGSQYSYMLDDNKTSSGVATTEPTQMREENALVGFLPKKHQSWWSRLISGKDKEQSEGPIGESILPAPSVGYSRVVVQNIHTGKTGTGFTVHEFNTVANYPFDNDYNYSSLVGGNGADKRKFDFAAGGAERGMEMSNLADNTLKDYLIIPLGFFNYVHKRVWAGQGFRFIVNQMHGQPASVKTYYGDPEHPGPISSATVYDYYQPGEQVKLLSYDVVDKEISYEWSVPGKSMTLAMESKNVHDNTFDFQLEVDLTVGCTEPPPIYLTAFPIISISDNQLSTHATSKIIRYPVILKSIETIKDNVHAKTEHLAFDKASGTALLTRTTDSFHQIPIGTNSTHDGSYYSINLPAHWYYEFMGARYANPDNANRLNEMAGNIVTYGAAGNPLDYTNEKMILPTGPDKVISASVNTFSNNINEQSTWIDGQILTEYGLQNASYPAIDVIWRPKANYVFKTDIKQSSDNGVNKIYEGGTFNSFTPFDYSYSAQNPDWTKVSEITKYSPNGNALEEIDNLNIPSAVQYGYRGKMLPVMVAKNAERSTIYFDDFEFNDPNHPSPNRSDEKSHSGLYSCKLPNLSNQTCTLTSTSRLNASGGLLRVWVNGNASYQKLTVEAGNSAAMVPQKIAQSGEWMLLSYSINGSALPPGGFTIQFTNNDASSCYLDDVSFQPYDAQATCFVYDAATLKLIAQFDDQHFGTYYQYNGEGKLVRKIAETERGIRTIQENAINKPKVDR